MKFIPNVLKAICLLIFFGLYGCDHTCIGGVCFIDKPTVKERVYDIDNKSFHLELDIAGEFNSHTFKLGELQTIERLSFGVHDAEVLRKYTAIKKIHILSDSALATYQEKYVIPGNACPVSFMNQNLQSLLLIPVSNEIAKQLEAYDIPFDGHGTPFKLTGHFMTPQSSYFISKGKTWTLDIERYEAVMSNFGSAQHKINYFLVTDINP